MGIAIRPVTEAKVFTCCCMLWALYGADVIIEGHQTKLSPPHPGPSSLTWPSKDMFEDCLSTLTFCFGPLYLQPRLVMEKRSTLLWPRREWEGLKQNPMKDTP